MSTHNFLNESSGDWSIVENRAKPKVLLVFGVKISISLVELKILCGDIGLGWLVDSSARNHMGI